MVKVKVLVSCVAAWGERNYSLNMGDERELPEGLAAILEPTGHVEILNKPPRKPRQAKPKATEE